MQADTLAPDFESVPIYDAGGSGYLSGAAVRAVAAGPCISRVLVWRCSVVEVILPVRKAIFGAISTARMPPICVGATWVSKNCRRHCPQDQS